MMGSTSSAPETVSPTSSATNNSSHYPQSRGPRTFEQVPNINVSSGKAAPTNSNQAQSSSVNQGASTSGKNSQENVHVAHNPTTYQDGVVVFETFHQDSGDYPCIYLSRKRYYVKSSDDQVWLPFPEDLYSRGILTTGEIIDDEAFINAIQAQLSYSPSATESAAEPSTNVHNGTGGQIRHPTKGPVYTHLLEQSRYVHCFFDESSGSYVIMPLALELLSPDIANMVTQIQRRVDGWTDRNDILAALRASNYDVEDCIRNKYLTAYSPISLSSHASAADHNLLQAKERKIHDLELQLTQLRKTFESLRADLQEAVAQNNEMAPMISLLEDKNARLEVSLRMAQAQNKSLVQIERPKTAAHKGRIEAAAVKSLAHNASLFHESYSKLKKTVSSSFTDWDNLLSSAVAASKRLPSMTGLVSREEMTELKSLYRKECLERKLLYNKLQELRGNIRVYARCRRADDVTCVLQFPSDEEVHVKDVRGNMQRFRFDKVYTPSTTQEQVFEDTCPIVTSCVDGYNVCILAYGQTGSGKTFTMMGPRSNPGINIRAIQELLRLTDERQNMEYTLSLSMVEIYNEIIQDLLTAECNVVTAQQVGNNVTMQGLTTHIVNTTEDITELMNMGMTNRTVASTKMNSESSRSHLLIVLTVEGRDLTTQVRTKGTLTLVDLAGSERVAKSEVSGQQLVEAVAINRSLSALGQVFSALGKSALHVPFRNSKLTQVLQPSLSGDAKAALFVAVSPAELNLSETLSTLTFGSNAKQIELGKPKKNITKSK
ncbi:hypothetical protein EB796_015936 [Bugula neritina]|uniref:Kinesin-like protein n=1 Tax=Bugula neritina TaxID=10212 RepID=A0A7J7JHU7_BUGNE|nr:hypothetical protein EB796_015936 [Bugula neritina]